MGSAPSRFAALRASLPRVPVETPRVLRFAHAREDAPEARYVLASLALHQRVLGERSEPLAEGQSRGHVTTKRGRLIAER